MQGSWLFQHRLVIGGASVCSYQFTCCRNLGRALASSLANHLCLGQSQGGFIAADEDVDAGEDYGLDWHLPATAVCPWSQLRGYELRRQAAPRSLSSQTSSSLRFAKLTSSWWMPVGRSRGRTGADPGRAIDEEGALRGGQPMACAMEPSEGAQEARSKHATVA